MHVPHALTYVEECRPATTSAAAATTTTAPVAMSSVGFGGFQWVP